MLPLSNIDTLIPDVEALFDGSILDAVNLATFAKSVADNFGKRFERYGTEYKRQLYLSNVGKPLRQLWYEIKSGLPGETLPANKKLNFLYGDILEDLALLLAVEAGHEVTDLQKEVEIDGVRGRIDCIIDGYVVDVKSCSSRSFEKFKRGTLREDDPFGYIHQLTGYSTALNDLPAAFWAIDKVLGHQFLYKITDEDYDVRQRIQQARAVLAEDHPPEEKCYPEVLDGVSKTAPFGNGNLYLPTGCSYCAYKRACHADANGGQGLRTFLYSTGPKFFTRIIKTPQVLEIKDVDNG